MDDIDNLHRVDFFYDDILMHIKARVESLPDESGKRRDMSKDPEFVARVIGYRYAIPVSRNISVTNTMRQY